MEKETKKYETDELTALQQQNIELSTLFNNVVGDFEKYVNEMIKIGSSQIRPFEKYEYYQMMVDEAKTASSKSDWIAEYGYPEDCSYKPEQLAEILGIIYDVAHGDIKSIVKKFKTMRAFCEFFNVPYATVQQWCSSAKSRTINRFTLRLIGYAVAMRIGNNEND